MLEDDFELKSLQAPTTEGGLLEFPANHVRRRGGSLWHQQLRSALIAAALLAPATDAAALWDDRLELSVSETVAHDSNVFRLSDSASPVTTAGASSKSDTYYTTTLGLNFDVPVSRQRFQGGYSWFDQRYDRFTNLNFDGYRGRAAWLWRAGSDLDGQIGYTESKVLASFADVQSGVQSSVPNPLLTQNAFANAGYRVTPRWLLRGEVARLEQTNDAVVRRANDVTVETAGGSISYVTPAETQIGLSYREDTADYPNPQIVGVTAIDNAYRQQTIAAVVDWILTGHSRLNVQGGRVRRNYEQVPQRDYEGPMARAALDWRPTGKFALTGLAQYDISSNEEVTIGLVIIKMVALRPAYRLTEKIDLAANLEYSDREYKGDAAQVQGLASARTDQVRVAALSASYRPIRTVRLEMSVWRESRNSTIAGGDYDATIASAMIRLGF
jgi:exopolysaccharide biosynthesis operon protein EpsL